MDQKLHRSRLLISFLQVYGNSKELAQEIQRGIFLNLPTKKIIESEMNWSRSSTEGFCLYFLSELYGISKEMDQELHIGLLLILLIKHVMNQ